MASIADCDAMIWEASSVETRENTTAPVEPDELEADVIVEIGSKVVEDPAKPVSIVLELLKEVTRNVELVDAVELDVGIVEVSEEAVEVIDEDDVGGKLGCTPKLSVLIISAALCNVR